LHIIKEKEEESKEPQQNFNSEYYSKSTEVELDQPSTPPSNEQQEGVPVDLQRQHDMIRNFRLDRLVKKETSSPPRK